jgi:hypothetical protein
MGFVKWYGREVPRAPAADPPTSSATPIDTRAEAAKSIAPLATNQRRRVFEFVTGRGPHGATDPEISSGTGLDGNTVRPRRGELVDSGHVVDSGRTRKTKSGRPAHVWVATGKPLD